eukprot:3579481-Amphidinium_carterae.1
MGNARAEECSLGSWDPKTPLATQKIPKFKVALEDEYLGELRANVQRLAKSPNCSRTQGRTKSADVCALACF